MVFDAMVVVVSSSSLFEWSERRAPSLLVMVIIFVQVVGVQSTIIAGDGSGECHCSCGGDPAITSRHAGRTVMVVAVVVIVVADCVAVLVLVVVVLVPLPRSIKT